MKTIKAIAGFTLLVLVWMGVPAAILFRLASWMASRTTFPLENITEGYEIAVAVLWLPTAFLVDAIYRKFFLRK